MAQDNLHISINFAGIGTILFGILLGRNIYNYNQNRKRIDFLKEAQPLPVDNTKIQDYLNQKDKLSTNDKNANNLVLV